jgi:glycosyltransferase involved in cell wall biosynthesis
MNFGEPMLGNPDRPIPGCAIYSPGVPGLPTNPFGKDVANIGLWRALARHSGFYELCFVLNRRVPADEVRRIVLDGEPAVTRITTAGIFDMTTIARMGTLVRGSADLVDLAWLRRQTGGDSDYSLVGLVHTIAPPAIRQYIAQCAVAPVQPWDALICTSPVVRQNLQEMFEGWNDFLRTRFRGDAMPRMPMLPVVPLGVDAAAIAAAADRLDARADIRARLSVSDDEVVVLWLGRLSFFEKAFPQPMFQALEQAHRRTGQRIHFVMLGWFPDREAGRGKYEEAARLHAPSIPVHILDGNDRALVGAMWASADIFLSLVDNIQETFGITILEAMSAGLPIVASDWDGYRHTIEHGQQGFLVPTLGGPPGLGGGMLHRHVFAMDTYQRYVGTIAQCTAVNIAKAADALTVLVREPALRRKMGASGRDRVRMMFDWPVIARQLRGLFDELAEIRLNTPTFEPSETSRQGDPVKSEPFSAFAAFASGILHDRVVLRAPAGTGMNPSTAFHAAELNRFAAPWRAELSEIERAYRLLCAREELTVGDLLSRFSDDRRGALQASLLWMCKLGLVDWEWPGR